MSRLSENLKFIRTNRNINQAEMIDLVGITGATWSNYENEISNPNLEKILKISKKFGISINDLLENDLQNAGDSEKNSKKIIQKNAVDNAVNNAGNRGKNYENKELDEIDEDIYLGDKDQPLAQDIDKEPLNGILAAFKAYFTYMHAHQAQTRQEIASLQKKLEEISRKLPP